VIETNAGTQRLSCSILHATHLNSTYSPQGTKMALGNLCPVPSWRVGRAGGWPALGVG
jgi:hypothetical protein